MGGYTGSSESTLVKMTFCWKSHIANYYYISQVSKKNTRFFGVSGPDPLDTETNSSEEDAVTFDVGVKFTHFPLHHVICRSCYV